jgi:predicted GNAT superfamily acetyltransferase
VQVEIPANVQSIRKENLALAIDWRLKTREIFETYFARGYVAVDFSREGQRNLYTLWRPPTEWFDTLTE